MSRLRKTCGKEYLERTHTSETEVPHKRTFSYLEQLILKHNAQKDTISIKEVCDGLDFFYSSKNHALKMVEFFASVAPIK